LPWIGKKSGRQAVADFVSEPLVLIERLRFDVKEESARYSNTLA
jgi:hypothetical protein